MKLTVNREPFVNALQLIIGVVERRQTLAVLANVLLKLTKDKLFVVGTDLEVELSSHLSVDADSDSGEITVPGRKLLDIVRSLPEAEQIKISLQDQYVIIRSGKSRFSLTTLPAADFPEASMPKGNVEFSLNQNMLLSLLERTHFAMAQQDVRYFLNGLLLELSGNRVRMVATDGHRLAMSDLVLPQSFEFTQVIIPRKGVSELLRMLNDNENHVRLSVGSQAIALISDNFKFVSRLIDGKFPDYDKVLPKAGDKIAIIDRDVLKQVLNRVSILSNEKYKVIRMQLKPNLMVITANNPDQEQAEEEIEIDYQGEEIGINFNVTYLSDVLSVLPSGNIKLTLSNPDTGVLIEGAGVEDSLYIVMPLRI